METQTISKALTSVWKFDWLILTQKQWNYFHFISMHALIQNGIHWILQIHFYDSQLPDRCIHICNDCWPSGQCDNQSECKSTGIWKAFGWCQNIYASSQGKNSAFNWNANHHLLKWVHFSSSLFHLTMFRVYFECFFRFRAVWNGVCCAGTITAGLVDGFKAVVISIQLSVCCQTSWKLNWHFMLI